MSITPHTDGDRSVGELEDNLHRFNIIVVCADHIARKKGQRRRPTQPP